MISYQLKLENCSVANNTEYARQLFFTLIDDIHLHIRGVTEYKFYPEGLVLSAILVEGHASIYTNPYQHMIDIDIYSDSLDDLGFYRCLEHVSILFAPRNIEYIVTDRDLMKIIKTSFSERLDKIKIL